MNLMPWRSSPMSTRRTLSPLTSLQQEIDRLFEQFFESPTTEPGWLATGRGWMPKLDVQEDDVGLHLTAELPGMSERDVQIQVTDDYLVLRGDKKAEVDRSHDGWRMTERSYGAFERSLPLGAEYDPERAQASFKRGVLTVTVPRKEGSRKLMRTIRIAAEH